MNSGKLPEGGGVIIDFKKIILGGQIDEFLKGGGDDANPNGIDQSMPNVPQCV